MCIGFFKKRKAMRETLRESLKIARKRERENPCSETTRRVRKIIYQAMQNTNKEFAQQYKEKHSL